MLLVAGLGRHYHNAQVETECAREEWFQFSCSLSFLLGEEGKQILVNFDVDVTVTTLTRKNPKEKGKRRGLGDICIHEYWVLFLGLESLQFYNHLHEVLRNCRSKLREEGVNC